jgi:hypothetical protein
MLRVAEIGNHAGATFPDGVFRWTNATFSGFHAVPYLITPFELKRALRGVPGPGSAVFMFLRRGVGLRRDYVAVD